MSETQRDRVILSLPCVSSEHEEIATQMGCLLSCLRTLFEVRFLVRSAALPEENRNNLLGGLDHIESHVVKVARIAIAEKRNRSN